MIKDSGKRLHLPGMVRDVTDNKIDYSLVFDGPLFERLAKHLTEGAAKYTKRNWMGAHTKEEYERFRESAVRHFIQYLRGDTDEDHFAAAIFNMNGMELVKDKLSKEPVVVDRRVGKADRRECFNRMDMHMRRVGMGRRSTDTTDYVGLPPCKGGK